MMKFNEKVVIVTGAGKGIGRAIALAYAKEGAIVVIAEKEQDIGTDTERVIINRKGRGLFIKTDVSIPESIENMVNKTVERFGRIDILINNVGIGTWKSLYDITVEEWNAVLNTNLRSVFLCSRACAKIMRNNGGGSIINIASTRAFMSEPNSELYAASKGGIVALTHALAASLAIERIQVNSISPGWIQTTDYEKLRPIDHLQHFSNRVGRVEDIAQVCLFLTQPENNFINAQNITIDGGTTKKMIYEPD